MSHAHRDRLFAAAVGARTFGLWLYANGQDARALRWLDKADALFAKHKRWTARAKRARLG